MGTKKILIDVGTNYVLNMHSGYDIVHCIEPNPEICKYLRENTNYIVHELAIDNFIDKRSFGISKIMEGHQKMGVLLYTNLQMKKTVGLEPEMIFNLLKK